MASRYSYLRQSQQEDMIGTREGVDKPTRVFLSLYLFFSPI